MSIIPTKGSPFPLGATKTVDGWNFAIHSRTPVTKLHLAPYSQPENSISLSLNPKEHLTGSIWHIAIKTNETALYYGYATAFHDLLTDPYAHLLNTGSSFGKNRYKEGQLLGIASVESYDWEGDIFPAIDRKELILYEMHLRGFTIDPSSMTKHPGSYLGLIEKIPYLKELGVNAIELLPIAEFDETETLQINPLTKARLYNFWGYSPLSFFSPMQRYATNDDPILAAKELKEMVKACHKAGIEVILDVVFNHTGEGNEQGRVFSWKGFAENDYYLKDEQGQFLNYSGCGNTFNCNHPIASDQIIEALRHWMLEYHIDGFRFDLASIMMRDQDGRILHSAPLVERITQDPILSRCKLIAEPWDASGLHQVGSFYQSPWQGPEQWMEWNDDFRTTIRRFIKGSPGYVGRFATKLCGSEDLYGKGGSPLNSINFVTCHDGFSLKDLVSYNQKHNIENGEDNRDGMNSNDSWNCGSDGPTSDSAIEALRQRQMKNFWLATLIAAGCPMLFMGDEYGHTKEGNNNSWCQDNSKNWFLWKEVDAASSLFRFCKHLIDFRKSCPLLKRVDFYKKEDIDWNGTDWSYHSQCIAFRLLDQDEGKDLFIAFNAHPHQWEITLPPLEIGKQWIQIANTSLLPPNDVSQRVLSGQLNMLPYSSLLAAVQIT